MAMIRIAGWAPTVVFAVFAAHLAAVTAVAGVREDCLFSLSDEKPDAFILEVCAGFITSGLGKSEQVATAYDRRAGIYLSRKEYDRAILEITEAIRHEPHKNYYRIHAEAFHEKGDFRAALADIELVLQREPDAGKYYLFSREHFRTKLGEFDRAIAGLEALRGNGDDEGVNLLLGLAYAGKGEYGKAIANFDDAFRVVNPADAAKTEEFAQLYVARGTSYEALGEPDKALADYQLAVKLKPNEPGAAEGVARVEAVRVAVSAMSSAAQLLDGAGRDPVQAYRWFDIAGRFFPPGARRDEAARARDQLAQTMTPAELTAARSQQ